MVGECAARTLYHNYRGFNFNRAPDGNGLHDCQVTNAYPGCYTHTWQARGGWDFYYGGYAGQDEVRSSRHSYYGMNTESYPNDFPPTLSIEDPYRRWGADCNRPTNAAERECSRYVLTGLYNDAATFDDMDRIRCYSYGEEFRVSQQVATVVDVALRWHPSEHQCPQHQVVTALSDTSDYDHSSVDLMKCNLLLSNWRVNYDECSTQDPSSSGSGPSGDNDNWHVDTPTDQIWAVVGLWRVNRLYKGFKSCRLYRIA
ncbi:uncharacterized protein LOC119106201 [Pollicipes pollicipes]|uniref:uncharacterized protein LOC119106201 n=1 Tax=Pollicipes pollicipes TaxID=41117 RepID=UPI001884E1C5|nr:uncharacterized protein LOC119106201 [Pollicipes pollicipes]